MSLVEMFGRVAKRMEFEIEDVRDAFTHGGVKGSALENAVVETVLRPYLPEKVGICAGQVIDALGAHSKQLDVVLYDRASTPTLKRSAEIRLLPAECVVAVIEVKATIASKPDIHAIFDNMASVRALSRDAITPDPRLHFVQINVGGRSVRSWPMHYSCFAFECTLAPETMNDYLNDEAATRGLSLGDGIDMVLGLNTGLWISEGTPVTFKRAVPGREMLEYYLRLHQHVSRSMMAGFLDLEKYLST